MRNDVPVSEQYRLAAQEWVEMDAAARMLEEGKTTYLAQQKASHGDIPDSKAERIVKNKMGEYREKQEAEARERQRVAELEARRVQEAQRKGRTLKTTLRNEAQAQLTDYGVKVMKVQLTSLARARVLKVSQSISNEET